MQLSDSMEKISLNWTVEVRSGREIKLLRHIWVIKTTSKTSKTTDRQLQSDTDSINPDTE